MKEFITYRLSATGLWQYEFRLDGEEFGKAMLRVAPFEPVRIEGCEISWYSRFDLDTEIIPGVSRRVKDNKTGEEVFRIIWWRPGFYEIRTKDSQVLAEIRNGCYLFGQPGAPVTAMTERTKGEPIRIRGLEAEACFRTSFFDPVSPAYTMIALAFPALRFC